MRGFAFYLIAGSIAAVLVGIVAAAYMYTGKDIFAEDHAPASDAAQPQEAAAPPAAGAELALICEVTEIIPAAGFGAPGNSRVRTLVAGIDFDKNTGWYQGSLVISEARKGGLTIEGNRLTFSRPAMFERFGSTISRETVLIDRATGALQQSVELSDGRKYELVKGYCGRLVRAPF